MGRQIAETAWGADFVYYLRQKRGGLWPGSEGVLWGYSDLIWPTDLVLGTDMGKGSPSPLGNSSVLRKKYRFHVTELMFRIFSFFNLGRCRNQYSMGKEDAPVNTEYRALSFFLQVAITINLPTSAELYGHCIQEQLGCQAYIVHRWPIRFRADSENENSRQQEVCLTFSLFSFHSPSSPLTPFLIPFPSPPLLFLPLSPFCMPTDQKFADGDQIMGGGVCHPLPPPSPLYTAPADSDFYGRCPLLPIPPNSKLGSSHPETVYFKIP